MTLDLGQGVRMRLSLIPAGTFLMGSPDKEWEGSSIGGARHQVTISRSFYMGVYEVTQQQYQVVAGRNPSFFKGKNQPVETVSWPEADDFCKRVSSMTGKTVRLPTEAEWEYACRAGTTTPFNTGKSISTDQANFAGDHPYIGSAAGVYRRTTTAVGSFSPNAFGLYDMHGNVAEWSADWYDGDYYSSDANAVDPLGPSQGKHHVIRGGMWASNAESCRSAARSSGYDPGDPIQGFFGFRVVVEK